MATFVQTWRTAPPHEARCFHCGRKTHLPPPDGAQKPFHRTRDHVKPKSFGGDEFVISCSGCNGVRGDTPIELFSFFVAANKGRFASMTQSTRAAVGRDYRIFVSGVMLAGFGLLKQHAQEARNV